MNNDILHNLLYECQCALFIVDLNSPDSFNHIQNLIQPNYNRWKTAFPYLKIIIVGNKNDLERRVKEEVIQSLVNLDSETIQSIEITLLAPRSNFDTLTEMIYKAQTNQKNKIPLNIVSMTNSLEYKNVSNGYKLVLLGDSGVGKTALIHRHLKNEFKEEFLSTIGIDDVTEFIKINNEQVRLQIWDTAGQERFRCLPRKYYQNADGILLLFSLDKKETFDNVSKWMNDIAQNANRVIGVDDINTTTLFLLGNKFDLEERVVSRQEAEKKAQECGMAYFEISCKLNINIDEVIANIVLRCYSKSTGVKDCFNLSEKPKSSGDKKKCCK